MKKIIIEGFVLLASFFLTWLLIAQIDWVTLFEVEKVSAKTEEKLGELFWEVFQKSEVQNNDPFVVSSVDSILNKICLANDIDRKSIKLHIIKKNDINAFALPNGHLVVYTGLISAAENQEELSGVLCHEIAHIQLNHVMKKLVKEVGLSFLISITTRNEGAEVIKETARTLSSTAFDRSMEKEADIKAVDFLVKAKINPEPFANFLYKLADKEGDAGKYFAWISTHPESKERAEYIVEYSKNKKTIYEPILAIKTWEKLKEDVKESDSETNSSL
jgi:predicted Zn-dependent protease